MASPAVHWLVDTALRAGVLAAGAPLPGPGTPLDQVWAAVTRAAGIGDDALALRVAERYRLRVADLPSAAPHAQSLVPEKVARRHGVFPLRQTDRELVVATSDPNDVEADQNLGFASSRTPVFEVAAPNAIREAIDARYAPERLMASLLNRVQHRLSEEIRVVEDATPEAVASHELDSAPVVEMTNLIIAEAVRDGVSDIHIEPGREGGVVRFRVDGVLRPFMQLPMHALNRVVSRIKIMGKLDIADRMRPQDGRARVEAANRTLDLRISTVPTRESEKAVIRLLDPGSARTLEQLGVPAPELARLRRLLEHRDGVVLVTGPTGSGKTTLLYAALRGLATGEVNIMTVEDPVEYELTGLTQIQVEPKRNVTFASALRSILRQDPDVIFVGEVRDTETAEMAVQASLTGHLVLATLHTNDAVGAVSRVADLGVERQKIAQTLRGVVAQRLVRRVCAACHTKVDGSLTADEERLAARYGSKPIVRAVGCAQCKATGYRGRVPILEVLTPASTFEQLVTDGASAAHLQKAALAGGMRPLLSVALELVRAGTTTLQEVERVLGESGGASSGGTEEAPAATGPHILVVDDDPVNRSLARAVLEKNGFLVSDAVDGVAALERLDATPGIALVVLDLDMPKLGGLEVLDRMRQSIATAALPVIVVTGSTAETSEIAAMERGADDYVRKPLDAPRFVARVKAALRRAAS